MLLATDEGIGNIMKRLQQRNLLDDTILIFTTDNWLCWEVYSNWSLLGNKCDWIYGNRSKSHIIIFTIILLFI